MNKPLGPSDFPDLVLEALKSHQGGAHLVLVAKYIWENYRERLEASKNILFTWQYDIRWAATKLRQQGKLKPSQECPKGVWIMSE